MRPAVKAKLCGCIIVILGTTAGLHVPGEAAFGQVDSSGAVEEKASKEKTGDDAPGYSRPGYPHDRPLNFWPDDSSNEESSAQEFFTEESATERSPTDWSPTEESSDGVSSSPDSSPFYSDSAREEYSGKDPAEFYTSDVPVEEEGGMEGFLVVLVAMLSVFLSIISLLYAFITAGPFKVREVIAWSTFSTKREEIITDKNDSRGVEAFRSSVQKTSVYSRNMDSYLAGPIIAKLRYIFSPYTDTRSMRYGYVSEDFATGEIEDLLWLLGEDRKIEDLRSSMERFTIEPVIEMSEEKRHRLARQVGRALGIEPVYFQDGFRSLPGPCPIREDKPEPVA